MSEGLSRREFFAQSGVYGGSLWLLLNLPRPLAARAAAASREPATLSAYQWKTVEAITGRIVPTDHEPGAIEANCVNFIDKALAHEDAQMKPLYERGLPGVDAVATKRYGKPFVELAPKEQDTVLIALESGEAEGWPEGPIPPSQFFEAVRAHTLIAFLADPKYGGNRDYVGWKLVGYPGPRHHLGGYSPAQMLGEEKIETPWGEKI